ncbi:MAG: PPK2 family polyphosphate kinase [Owenweeksia sp.]|nr:PPK2 family polyphosphate kinase [Owenweeksia sp.]
MAPLIDLDNISTLPPEGVAKSVAKQELKEVKKSLFELQNKFYADGRFGLLIILQGMDASGKDGIIRHVFSSMNPQGVHVKSFKKPTEEELSHDFLWRIYPHIPPKGMIQIFNRSYYEDIIMPMVAGTSSDEMIAHRCQLFKSLEEHLEQNNIKVVKIFLHISEKEQAKKIKERLTKPHKRWKYSVEDKKAANLWDEYQTAYNSIINNCDNPDWHIIPANKKWYRNYQVALTLCEHLKKLDLNYPNSTK